MAEKGFVCLGNVKELRYDCGDTAEVDRPLGTTELVCDIAVDVDVRTKALGIHVCRLRMKDGIDADAFERPAVFFKTAWIGVKIFIGAELGWVDEDRCDDEIRRFFCRPHQRQMAFM